VEVAWSPPKRASSDRDRIPTPAGASGHGDQTSGQETGEMSKDRGSFGFIQGDNGEEMFVMPRACTGFDLALPRIGTRVKYWVVADEKTGRPRAENVEPVDVRRRPVLISPPSARDRKPAASARDREPEAYVSERHEERSISGIMARNVGSQASFGFIDGDDGQEMFVMPAACKAFGGLPPLGTRLSYEVVIDSKTGRPRAENCMPERAAPAKSSYGPQRRSSHSRPDPYAGREPLKLSADSEDDLGAGSGIVDKIGHTYGFIVQDSGVDSGDDRMFFMPGACVAFGGRMPPVGTRVQYRIVKDAKTGRPRAEDVEPDMFG